MKLTMYQIDAFASKAFEGNPAAVIPLDEWLNDELMQNIAEENNLSETVFFVLDNSQAKQSSQQNTYHIRWFTPVREVALCGHATLAAAYVLFNIIGVTGNSLSFNSLSGPLAVTKNDQWLHMDFPCQRPDSCEIPQALREGLGGQVVSCLQNKDYIAVYESEAELAKITPDFSRLKDLDLRGVIATAPSQKYDFVARFFAPKFGIEEDPVTGSAFTQLIPYWASRLNKQKLTAKQISKRGGELVCELKEDRVEISGKAISYMKATIEI